MSLGTDTNPQSVIEAMRWAAVCSKMVERNTEATTAAHAFDAATLGGARALGRDDLGRIAPGAKADLVLWKATSWRMTPLRDPIKNIVYNAADEDVDRVYVNGRLVVDGGKVLAADDGAILGALQAAGERMWPRMAKSDWAGRAPTSSPRRPTPTGTPSRARSAGALQERGRREGREHLAERRVGLVVPARLVQQVQHAERAAVLHDRHVQDRRAAEGGDQRVVEEHLADVVRGVADVGLALHEEAPRPRAVRHRLPPPTGYAAGWFV